MRYDGDMATFVATDRLTDLIAEELEDLTALRRDLHSHPELGYQEHRTSGIVQEQLERVGIAHVGGLAGGTGVLGHLPGRADRAIGLRADMDALPISERTGLPYASTRDGLMHACGHDGHTTILIGVSRVLARLSKEMELPRPVTLTFQPAEEGGGGGKRMVDDGCLDGSVIGPPVENMFGLHGWPQLTLGEVGTRPGPLLAAADTFEITIEGTGSHAAFPHLSADPIVAGSQLVSALQSVVSRNVGPLDSAVVSVTQFHSGTAHNIIPGRTTVSGTVRTLKPEVQATVRKRLAELADGIAASHGCAARFEYREGYPVTSNDHEMVNVFNTVARQTIDPEQVLDIEHPVMGGEDFSFYGQRVPACFFVVGLCPPDQESMPSLHQPTFDFNDDAIALGIELFCGLALRD